MIRSFCYALVLCGLVGLLGYMLVWANKQALYTVDRINNQLHWGEEACGGKLDSVSIEQKLARCTDGRTVDGGEL